MDQNVKAPLVSVMMPVYNCGAYVAEAIESILYQDYAAIELIIIDDCSTDDTGQIISRYDDDRIVFIKKPQNTGHIASLNHAIEIASGSFLARMDGDDISHPERLAKQVAFLTSNPDIALCGCWYQLMPSNEVVKNPVNDEDIKIGLLDYCALGHPTVMLRKDFLTANQLKYDPLFFPAEDYELWTRIAAIGKMANIQEVLLYYRSHENQVSLKEQYRQINNSFLCKIRMMCYPLSNASEPDIKMSEEIVKYTKIDNILKLKETVGWLDQLFNSNKMTGFYAEQKFKKFIVEKQETIIRRFFLHSTSYNPSVLYNFYRSGNKYQYYFSLKENIKLILKCIVCWK